MGNAKNRTPERQDGSNAPHSSIQDALAKMEKRIEESHHENEQRILEAKISVSESRVTYLLVILGLLGIIFPFWMTNRNADRVDEAIKDMEIRFKELAGEHLRKPDVVCELDGAPLAGRTLVVGPNEASSQSFVIRNAGDASAGTTYVHLYLKEAPAGLGYLGALISDNPHGSIESMDPSPSGDARFGAQYRVMVVSAFHTKREFSLRVLYSPGGLDATLDVEIPAMLKVYYDAPQPLEVPFTMKMIPGKR